MLSCLLLFRLSAQLSPLPLRLRPLLRGADARLQFLLVQQAGEDVAQVRAQLFQRALAISGIFRMDQRLMLKLFDYLRRLLQASVELEEPLV